MAETRTPTPIEYNKPERPSVRQLFDTLTAWPDNYQPTIGLDRTLSLLTNRIIDPTMTHDLSPKEVSELRRINSVIEYHFEREAVSEIVTSPNSIRALEHFTFMESYVKFTRLEKALIDTNTDNSSQKPWLFVGGGPLPVSAILFAREYGIQSTVIDVATEAVDMSSALIEKLENEDALEKGAITIEQANAEQFTDYANHEVIFVAALAGETSDSKRTIFRQINQHAPDNAHILARSSAGNRQLLYLPLPQDVYDTFDLVYELNPHNDVINSMVLLKNRQPQSSEKAKVMMKK